MPESGECIAGNFEIPERSLERVKEVLSKLFLNPKFEPLEMVTVGGSFAAGTVQPEDDLDLRMLLSVLPDEPSLTGMNREIIGQIRDGGFVPHIGAYIDRTGDSVTFSHERMLPVVRQNIGRPEILPLVLFRKHPDTPYVARNDEAEKFWRGIYFNQKSTSGKPKFIVL